MCSALPSQKRKNHGLDIVDLLYTWWGRFFQQKEPSHDDIYWACNWAESCFIFKYLCKLNLFIRIYYDNKKKRALKFPCKCPNAPNIPDSVDLLAEIPRVCSSRTYFLLNIWRGNGLCNDQESLSSILSMLQCQRGLQRLPVKQIPVASGAIVVVPLYGFDQNSCYPQRIPPILHLGTFLQMFMFGQWNFLSFGIQVFFTFLLSDQ